MKWISIDEQKPPYGWMLVVYRYHADPKILCSDFGLHTDGTFIVSGVKRDVTHWMPIPPPPKEIMSGQKS